MGIRAEIKVGSISHFSIHYQEAATPNKVKDQDPRQLRRFPEDKPVSQWSTPLTFHWYFCVSAARGADITVFQRKTTALPWSCRHVHPYCCLRFRTSHSPFCVTIHPARPQKPPHHFGDSTLLFWRSSHFEDACHPQRKSPSRRHRPQRCPPWHPKSPCQRFASILTVAVSCFFAAVSPVRLASLTFFPSGSRRDQWIFHLPTSSPQTMISTLSNSSCRALTHKTAGSARVRIPIGRTIHSNVGAAGYPEPPFTRVCENFNRLDVHCRRATHRWVTSKRVMATSAVCPRLFENFTTSTFGTLRRNQVVSTAFESIEKSKQNCQEHNRSWKRSACSEKRCQTHVGSQNEKRSVFGHKLPCLCGDCPLQLEIIETHVNTEKKTRLQIERNRKKRTATVESVLIFAGMVISSQRR